MRLMKLSAWAAQQGVHYQTAWRWWKHGTLPVPARQLPSGTILVDVPAPASLGQTGGGRTGPTVLYARVSAHDQRADLDRQIARVVTWAADQRFAVDQVVAEVGSGLNGRRAKLRRLLADAQVATIVVEHRDRLALFGVEHLEAALAAQGRRIVVLDPAETSDDLVHDMVEVLTSFCARLYGRRGARNRALRALTAAKRSA
jgi:putative resolvase